MIVSRLIGGLGNQMFQYALAKKLALKNETSVAFDLFLLHDHSSDDSSVVFRNFDLDIFILDARKISLKESQYFNGKRSNSFAGKLINKFLKVLRPLPLVIEKDRSFHPEILSTKNNMCLVGAWQSPKYFSDIENELRKDFQFRDDFICKDSPFFEKIKSSEIPIAVHFRRGDYIHNDYYNEILGELPISYYQEAYNILSKTIPNATYFIFSDDIEWCKKNVRLFPNPIFVENEKSKKGMVTDLLQISNCHHQIISHSTFAWWGAWLNDNKNKKVLAPKRWVSEKYIGDPTIHAVDIIPEDWILI